MNFFQIRFYRAECVIVILFDCVRSFNSSYGDMHTLLLLMSSLAWLNDVISTSVFSQISCTIWGSSSSVISGKKCPHKQFGEIYGRNLSNNLDGFDWIVPSIVIDVSDIGRVMSYGKINRRISLTDSLCSVRSAILIVKISIGVRQWLMQVSQNNFRVVIIKCYWLE